MAEENKVDFQNTETSRLAKGPIKSGATNVPQVPRPQTGTAGIRPLKSAMDTRNKGTVKLKPISASETGQIPIDTGAAITDSAKFRVLKEKSPAIIGEPKQTVRVKTPPASGVGKQIRQIKPAPSVIKAPVSDETAKIQSAAAAGKTLKLNPVGTPSADKTVRMKAKPLPNKTLKLTPAGGKKTLKLKSDDGSYESADYPSSSRSTIAPLLPELGHEMGGFLSLLNILTFVAALGIVYFVLSSCMNLGYFSF